MSNTRDTMMQLLDTTGDVERRKKLRGQRLSMARRRDKDLKEKAFMKEHN